MVADHLVDDEAEKLFAELGIELRLFGQRAQTRDLPLFPAGIRRRQGRPRFVLSHRLRDAKPFGEDVDKGRIDIVDRPAKACKNAIF